MSRLRLLLLGLTWLAPVHANAWVHGRSYVPICPYGTSYTNDNGVGDGCAGSNPFGSYIDTNFATEGQGSGQTWTSAHPWSWNAAGSDYRVGYDTTLTLNVVGVNTLPSGCTVAGHVISCGSVVSGPVTIDWEGWDLTDYQVVVVGNDTNLTHITFNNCKFVNGLDVDATNGSLIKTNGSATSLYLLTVTNSVFDGGASPTSTACGGSPCTHLTFRDLNLGHLGNLDFERNAIGNSSGRPITWNGQATGGFSTVYYNASFGWVASQNSDHGELIEHIVGSCTVTATSTTTSLSISAVGTCASGLLIKSGQGLDTNGFTGTLNGDCQLVSGGATCPITGGSTVSSSASAAVGSNVTVDYEYNSGINFTWQPVANTAFIYPSSGASNGAAFSSVKLYNNISATNTVGGQPLNNCTATGSMSGTATLTMTSNGNCGTTPLVVGALVQQGSLANGQSQVAAVVTPWNGSSGTYTLQESGTFSANFNVQNAITAAAMMEIGRNAYGTVILHNNYMDHTGATECFQNAGSQSIGSTDFGTVGAGTANFSLTTGNAITGYNVVSGSAGCN